MNQTTKTKFEAIIGRIAKGCMGLRYAYFNQGDMNSSLISRELAILGDFQGKEDDPWRGGVCFGLSILYLAASSPRGRSSFGKSAHLMKSFDDALNGDSKEAGMLNAIAHAFVRQKKASVVRKTDLKNPTILRCKGCGRAWPVNISMSTCLKCGSSRLVKAPLTDEEMNNLAKLKRSTVGKLRLDRVEQHHKNVIQTVNDTTLERFRAKERDSGLIKDELSGQHDDPHTHALRDKLMANFAFKPSPPHDRQGVRANYRSFDLKMENAKGDNWRYSNHFEAQVVKDLLSFTGQKNTYSLLSYERMFSGGHAMAIWGGGSRVRFFDPNMGVISFSYQSGLRTFLSRYLSFMYCWNGATGKTPPKDSKVWMSGGSRSTNEFKHPNLDLDVYRYSL